MDKPIVTQHLRRNISYRKCDQPKLTSRIAALRVGELDQVRKTVRAHKTTETPHTRLSALRQPDLDEREVHIVRTARQLVELFYTNPGLLSSNLVPSAIP